ncbi:MAG TPA: S8 family serine peptidase, partial [Actinoplanes sp.]|nr:S8 family serine peptidase [Actinoplanes sp.]
MERVDRARRRWRIRWAGGARAALAGIVAAVVVAVTMPASVPARADSYVIYYTVNTAYQGKPENLSEIASRFLGGADRAIEIYNLNVGRKQADGGSLTDANKLAPGWRLVLPYDAVGAGVQYGPLPTTAAASAKPGASASAKPSTGKPSTGPSGSSGQTPNPQASQTGSAAPKPSGGKRPTKDATPVAGGDKCAVLPKAGNEPDWARALVGAETAWARSRGSGQMIAVIDTGVDGSLPELTGHVAQGVDIVSGKGNGDVDCLGSGTAMGAIAAAQPGAQGTPAGVAPDATLLPVRVVTTGKQAQVADQATAITVAVAAGATVIALGGYFDTSDPAVTTAIAEAVEHDVVVVTAAPLNRVPVNPAAALPTNSVLRVGGVGQDGQPLAEYRMGAVDVVAPGDGVLSLGPAGIGPVLVTGNQYAVAFVAGQVALVRSAYPALAASAVVDRIKRTSDSAAGHNAGAGMMDPAS